jgi:hypothetical protein
MPAKSKQQQKFFGVVKAMQKGDIPKKGEAGEVADDMTKKEVDKMASTKHKNLVNKIKELVEQEISSVTEVNQKVFDIYAVLGKALTKATIIPKAYRADYGTSLINMSTRDERSFMKDYGMFSIDDFIEDMQYNMTNEAKLPDEGFSEPEQMREAHKLVKVLGGYPVTYEGDPNNYRAIISEPMNDRQKEDMIKKAKQAGYIAKPNMGGGVTIFVKENKITEAKSANALRADYDKAVKKEQALSSLLLVNLEKFKAAKAKGDEKAVAKHTKIAGDLSKKKKDATEKASKAYKAYQDKITGLHSDAELELKEGMLNEMDMNDPVLMAFRASKQNMPKSKSASRKISFDKYLSLLDMQTDLQNDIKELADLMAQTLRDMEQEAEPGGGPAADRYASLMMKQEKEYKILKAKKAKVDVQIDKYQSL